MISYKLYNSVINIPTSWDKLTVKDIFLKTNFLNALELSSPDHISSFYLAIYNNQELVGIAIIQRVEMYLDNIFRKTSDHTLKRLGKAAIARIVRGNALIVGNLMHTGQHGYYFNSNKIHATVFFETVFKALKSLEKTIKKESNKTIRIIGFKDYFKDDVIHLNTHIFDKNSMYKVKVQPNMIFNIPSHFNSISDYKIALNKKYKRRYNTAIKKSSAIVKKELLLEDIKLQGNALYKLYKHVSDQAKVNSFILKRNHFYQLKLDLQSNFKIFGYYLNNELIGFYTLILNNSQLETYFLGYNPRYQQEYQMYLNMLYDMLEYGIDHKFKSVVYARTAMEIKSSVGANPNDMFIYMKHTNTLFINPLLKFVVNTLNPIKKWEQRHPFK
ncbi:GNAT family N-acetyltransferase [Mesoflavibacter profundi]|uniref:GNAT family N-acetyltransferase n=1 Tax=Mesoflavibacter profundi TaxID=2708110 RepID=UPI0035193460